MARRDIEVPLVPKLIKRVDQILNESGMTRRSIIKGDTIEAYGEVGIKGFYIYLDEVIDDDTAILIIDANNRQSLDIISNLIQTGLEELYQEHKEREEIRKKLNINNDATNDTTNKDKIEKKCSVCTGELADLGIKNLAENFKARVMACQECGRLEFYKE